MIYFYVIIYSSSHQSCTFSLLSIMETIHQYIFNYRPVVLLLFDLKAISLCKLINEIKSSVIEVSHPIYNYNEFFKKSKCFYRTRELAYELGFTFECKYRSTLLDIGTGNGERYLFYKWKHFRKIIYVEPDHEKNKSFERASLRYAHSENVIIL
ncbi:hypothetical protein BCR32DRAFT_277998 [Anaeromyces robustus]|uniref:Methyltransferase domain-containing protein n=1 Tax=Anaeromyces robustus TaxID=1754192 RepID=A0A1Y1XCN2_9FUNG|nr:hypothetical protein BCR32DRAFT_277998 [Anaeromyces robustus]|eukprot:ORX83498.1 hypothetical protein BCR32DRAFT_277998 [Anaeromyces robustus]